MNDAERELSDLPVRAYDMSNYGSVTEQEIAMEFWQAAGESLEADGFLGVDEARDSLHLPPSLHSWGRQETVAIAGLAVWAIKLAVFLGTAVGTWAVEKVADEIWERALQGPLRKLQKRRRKEKYSAPVSFAFGAWYDTDGVYIGAAGDISVDDDPDHIGKLVAEAQRRGLEWLEAHGITKPVLIFAIRNGELARFPTLLDAIP